jgi:hypothetical protein
MSLGPEPREVALASPMSVHRDEYGAEIDLAVYRLAVAPHAGGPAVVVASLP